MNTRSSSLLLLVFSILSNTILFEQQQNVALAFTPASWLQNIATTRDNAYIDFSIYSGIDPQDFRSKASTDKTFVLKKKEQTETQKKKNFNTKSSSDTTTSSSSYRGSKRISLEESSDNIFQSSKPNGGGEVNGSSAKVELNGTSEPNSSSKKPYFSTFTLKGYNAFMKPDNGEADDNLSVKDEKKKSTPKEKTMNDFFGTFTLKKDEPMDKVPRKEDKKNSIRMEKTPLEKLKSRGGEERSIFDFFKKGNNIEQSNVQELQPGEEVITNDITGYTTTVINADPQSFNSNPDPDPDLDPNGKFSFTQRIESVKTGLVGLLVGGIALSPFTAFHDILLGDSTIANGIAQWEFDTDTGSIGAALFAIVYRYCVRDGEESNEMLQMGVIGAFVLIRTFARIRVPVYCTAVPLDCGEPFGYFDDTMIQQAIGSGLESIVMFGVTALAMEFCYEKRLISRFK